MRDIASSQGEGCAWLSVEMEWKCRIKGGGKWWGRSIASYNRNVVTVKDNVSIVVVVNWDGGAYKGASRTTRGERGI